MVEGHVAGFFMLVIMVGSFFYSKYLAGSGRTPKMQYPESLKMVEEAIGKAIESGKAVHFSPGTGPLVGREAPQVFAALSILGFVARTAARLGGRVITTIRYPEVMPAAQEVVKSAYEKESRMDLYNEEYSFRYLSTAQFAYTAGVVGLMERESVGANFLIGPFIAEALILAETGTRLGAKQVTGTANLGNLPFFIAASDYTLIGEELYATGAFASEDTVQIAGIRGQDLIKVLLIGIIILGIILKILGVADLAKLLLS